MALTDTKVRSAKPEAKEYSLVDGDGMFLLIHPNGSKYWRFRFRFGGKQHLMAFGVYPETSLADARHKREAARKLVAAGIDPREQKRAVKEELAKEVFTFEVVAREWHATNKKWQNPQNLSATHHGGYPFSRIGFTAHPYAFLRLALIHCGNVGFLGSLVFFIL